jgi:hypothetical protein
MVEAERAFVIPSENASPAGTEGSRCAIFKVPSSGSFDFATLRYASLRFAQDDPLIGRRGMIVHDAPAIGGFAED